MENKHVGEDVLEEGAQSNAVKDDDVGVAFPIDDP